MNVLSFPMYVKVAHFCFGSSLLGFYGEGGDIQLFGEWDRKRIIVNNIMNTIKIFTFKGPCIVKYMPIIVKQDATCRERSRSRQVAVTVLLMPGAVNTVT